MKRAVIIVAAGSGSRMGEQTPKQYLDLAGKPLIVHTLERFISFDPEMRMVVVLAPGRRNLWEQLAATHRICDGAILAEGGATRHDSVKKGLVHIGEDCIVGVHDAVRPLVSQSTLTRSYKSAEDNGSGIPVLEMEESIRMLNPQGDSTHLNRSLLKRVQTPQVFRSEQLKKAYEQAYDPVFTDDASVYEATFGKLCLVEGNRENIKITTPFDMKLASLLMASVE